MCKLRSYKHSCGHTTHRPLSACRFTFATGERALCHAAPDLTITLPDECRTCIYRTFCDDWENRIADARSRQSDARMLLRNILLEEPDDELAWGGFHDGTEHHACFSDYTESARRKRDAADREVEQLWAQYQREQHTLWRPLITGPNHNTESPNKQRLRRRRTSRRCSGDSPLRLVTSASDLELNGECDPVPEAQEDYADNASEASWFPGAEDSSDDSGSESDDDDQSVEASSPRTPPGSQENLAGLRSWAWPVAAAKAAMPVVAEEGDDDTATVVVAEHCPLSKDPMQALRESVKQWAPDVKVGAAGAQSRGRRGSCITAVSSMSSSKEEEDLALPDWGMA